MTADFRPLPVETREFYILAAIKERWSKRELEQQIFHMPRGCTPTPPPVSLAALMAHSAARLQLAQERQQIIHAGALERHLTERGQRLSLRERRRCLEGARDARQG